MRSPKRGGGSGYVKYALIGLAQYSFHYDLSKAYGNGGRIFQYYITFDDVHNFWLPKEKFSDLFNEQYLATTLQGEILDVNNIYGEKVGLQFMDWEKQFNVRKSIDDWKNKSYPETVEENVKILDDYLTLCEEKNVRPIIFLAPLTRGYKKYFNRKMINEFYYLVREAQKKHSTTIFLDGWSLPNFSDRDFYDSSHLNAQGAAKFSVILNGIIEQIENSNQLNLQQ